MTFTLLHQSGKWEATAAQWDERVAEVCAEPGVDIATFTETTKHQPDAPEGWGRCWFEEASDAALYYDRSVWHLVTTEGVQIAHTTYTLGSNKPKPPLHALVVTLKDIKTKRRVVVAVVHQPSAIEGEVYKDQAGKRLAFPRIRAFFEGIHGLHVAKRRAHKASPGAAWLFVEDSNLDWHKRWVRAFTKARFPKLTCSWKHIPAGGTEGPRLIDIALTQGLDTAGSRIGQRAPGFDHLPFKTVYGFRKKKAPAPPVTVNPYALTTHDGKKVDCLTDAALIEAEKRLGYPLTIVQGSYNAGGVGASAGTHDGGGAVDLAPYDWAHKVRVMRAVGFAAWHRPTIPGVWNEHIHCILVSDAKASPAAKAQIVDYRNHRDGLAGHGFDNTWHPNPIPEFALPATYQPHEGS